MSACLESHVFVYVWFQFLQSRTYFSMKVDQDLSLKMFTHAYNERDPNFIIFAIPFGDTRVTKMTL